MAILTEPSRPATPPTPGIVLSQSDVLSTASSIIQSYPSITSAYLFGSYAKGTARPDSDIDIALFIPNLCWDTLPDVGGVQMDLEGALDRQIDISVCPPDDFVERIKRYWVPINLHCGKPGIQEGDSSSSSSSSTQGPNQAQVSSGSSGILPISQSSSATTTSPPSPPTPMEIAGGVESNIAGQNVNEEAVRCREECGSSLSKKEPEPENTAKS